MNYKRLVEMDLKMLWLLTDINPEYQKFIDKILWYGIIDKKDYNRYLKMKEKFIQEQQYYKQNIMIEMQKGKFWSR